MLTCPMGKDACKWSMLLILNLEKGATALAKQNKFACCLPKGQAEMQVFLSPGWDIAIILITNRWKRNCFSWIYFFENFLHLLFTPFFSLKCAPLLRQCWAMHILEHWDTCNTQINIGEGEMHTSVSRFLTSIVGCRGSSGYVPNQEVESFKQCIV